MSVAKLTVYVRGEGDRNAIVYLAQIGDAIGKECFYDTKLLSLNK